MSGPTSAYFIVLGLIALSAGFAILLIGAARQRRRTADHQSRRARRLEEQLIWDRKTEEAAAHEPP